MRFLILMILILIITGCSCKTIEVVEQKMTEEQREVYDVESYVVEIPYFVNVTKTVEKTVQREQEPELEACGNFLLIKNPSDEDMILEFKTNDQGYLLMHTKEPVGTSYYATVFFADKEPWMPKNRFTIDDHDYMDLVIKGIPPKYDSIEECSGSTRFDLDKIKELDIKVVDPKVTDATIYEDVVVKEKKYRKELRNRTVVRTETIRVPRNVTVTKIQC
ncbi:MAG: hypothetical protein R6V53_03910 [Candidatus Woesearchaeota archaeon]